MLKTKKNKFYTEIKVGITIDTDLSLEDIQVQLDEGLGAQLKLVQRDVQVAEAETLEVWEVAPWQDWEDM